VQLRPPSQPGEQALRDADAWSMSCTGDDVGISNLAWNDLDWEDARAGVTWSGTADARPTQDDVRPAPRTATLVEAAFEAISSDPDPTRPSVTVASSVKHAPTLPLGKSPRLGRIITGDAALAEPPRPLPSPTVSPTVSDWAAATPPPQAPQMRYSRRASAHPIVAPLASQPSRRPPPLPPLSRAPRATPNPDTTGNETIILTQSVDPVLLSRLAPTAPVPAQSDPDEPGASRTIPSIVKPKPPTLNGAKPADPAPLKTDARAPVRPTPSSNSKLPTVDAKAPVRPTPPSAKQPVRPTSSPKVDAQLARPTPSPNAQVRPTPSPKADAKLVDGEVAKPAHGATLVHPPGSSAKTVERTEPSRSLVDGPVTPPASFSQRTYSSTSLAPDARARPKPEIRAPQPGAAASLLAIPAMSVRLDAVPPPAPRRPSESVRLSTAPRLGTIGVAALIATVAVLGIVSFATRSEDGEATTASAAAAPGEEPTVTAPVQPAPPSAAHEVTHVQAAHVPVPPSAPVAPSARRQPAATKAAGPCRPTDPTCGL
jgi:hypothetical protein